MAKTDTTDPNAYPWKDCDGLSTILEAPEVWVHVVTKRASITDPLYARKRVKKTIKRYDQSHNVVSIEDDASFGAGLARLMQKRNGRAALMKHFAEETSVLDPSQYLAQAVFRSFQNRLPSDWQQLEDFCDQRDDRWFLSVAKFKTWLDSKTVDDSNIELLAALISSFAILQPEIRKPVYEYVVSNLPDLRPLLDKPRASVVRVKPANDPSIVKTAAAEKNHRAKDIDEVGNSKSLIPILQQWELDTGSLTIAQSSELVEQLSEKLDEVRGEKQRYASFLVAAQKTLGELNALTEISFVTSEFIPCLDDLTIDEACRELRELTSTVETVREAIFTRRELLDRLGRSGGDIQVAASIDALRDSIGEDINSLRSEISQKANRERKIEALLQEFLDLSVVDRPVFIEVLSPSDVVELGHAIFGPPLLGTTDSLASRIRGDFELVGLLAGSLATSNSEDTVALVGKALQVCDGDRLKTEQILEFLSPEGLLQVAVKHPERTIEIAELMLAAAIKANDHSRLSVLHQFTELSRNHQGPYWKLYEAFASSAMHGDHLDLQTTLRTKTIQKEPPEKHLTALFADLDRHASSTAGPLFHTLHEIARERFLVPLRSALKQRQLEVALRQWQQSGDFDSKVEACVAGLPAKERRRVEPRHRRSLNKYLDAFDARLRLCAKAFRVSQQSSDNLISELQSFRNKHGDSKEPNTKRLMELISQSTVDSGVSWPAEDFACRVSNGEISDDYSGRIQPTALNSWLAKSCGEPVRVGVLAADYLTGKLGGYCDSTDEHCIRFYLDRGAYDAAKSAANGNAQLQAIIASFLEVKKSVLLESPIVAEAKKYRSNCPNIEFMTEGFFTALNATDFDDANDYLSELGVAIEEYKFLADPENRRLYNFVCELGVATPPQSRATMEELAENAKAEAGDRRYHVEQLISATSQLPTPLSDCWAVATIALDSPKHWPRSDERSFEIAEWIEFFADFLKRKVVASPDFAMQVSAWFLGELERITDNDSEIRFDEFLGFKSLGERTYWDEAELLKLLPNVDPSEAKKNKAEPPDNEPHKTAITDRSVAEDLTQANMPAREGLGKNDVRQLLSWLRREIAPYVSAEIGVEESDENISRSCIQEKWDSVRKAIANKVFEDTPDNHLTDEECIYVIALSQTEAGKAANELGLVGLAAEQVYGSRYYLREKSLQEVFNQIATNWIRGADSTNVETTLTEHIRDMPDARRGDRRRVALEKLLRKCACIVSEHSVDRGDFAMSRWLWDADRGGKHVAETRSRLLHFLFQIGRFDLLQHLAEVHANPLRAPIDACLRTFNQGESNEAALEEAQQLSRIVVEQAGSRFRPWKKLLARLDQAPKEYVDDEPLRVRKESIQRVGNELVLQLLLIPSRYDWPNHLQLKVGEEGGDIATTNLLAGDTLTRPRLVAVKIPIEHEGGEDEFLRVPFEIEGSSEKTPTISVRGSWTLDDSDRGKRRKLDLSLLQRYWPGADGKDVKSENAHHGREDLLGVIDNALRAHDGFQKSLIVIGQRRIGKTSLLNQVVTSYPPRKGACSAAYADVSSFDRTSSSLREALFTRILDQIEFASGDKNKLLFDTLTEQGAKLSRIVRDISPKRSLSSALEGLSKAFEFATDGKVSRLALCLDEFHNVFAWPDEEEVNSLMWDLRQVVQSSNRVSLLMAGSGLTRRLIDQLDQALFGSIESIELRPFDPSHESKAIADTFLPKEIRHEIAPDPSQREQLIEKARELTGGHPWYLSILGSSMASYFGITKTTPAMLTHVAEELLAGNVARVDKDIPPKYFYFHLFGSLNVLHRREESLARLVLLEIARNTSFEYPWLKERRLLDAEGLCKLCNKREVRKAIKTLCTEMILDKDTDSREPRYRIRIPLVASALKQDANELESDALAELDET